MSASFQLSPGIRVTESDLTNVIPNISSNPGATVGYAEWGPMAKPTFITSENSLVETFGKPNDRTYSSFFTAANFLSYSSNLLFTRCNARAAFNADCSNTPDTSGGSNLITTVKGSDVVDCSLTDFDESYVGKWLVSSTGQYIGLVSSVESTQSLTLAEPSPYTITDGSYTIAKRYQIKNKDAYDAGVVLTGAGVFVAKYPGAKGDSLGVYMCDDVNFSKAGVGTLKTCVNIQITKLSLTSNVVTITTGKAHNLAVGQSVIISGQPGYNGTVTVATAPTTKTFTFAKTAADVVEFNSVRGMLNSKQINGTGTEFLTAVANGEWVTSGNMIIGQVKSVTSDTLATLHAVPPKHYTNISFNIKWKYYQHFDTAPGTTQYCQNINSSNDGLHILIADENGLFSGVAGTILEKFAYVSKAGDALTQQGAKNYYKEVINAQSKYLWWANHPSGMSNWGSTTDGVTYTSMTNPYIKSLSGGSDGDVSKQGDVMAAFGELANVELYDVGLIAMGKADVDLANYVIQNVAEIRKDCVVFVSPQNIDTDEFIVGATTDQTEQIRNYADLIVSSSYAFIDSGVKYQYDQYKDTYRWVPLNGDIAGLTARADFTNDPWWSPAGYNRGIIKNAIKLGYNPFARTERDILYQSRVNPVVAERGQGILLLGDKTALSKPSAFDRINVRRLFITLEKAISTAAKYMLFEFNDTTTRNLFVGMLLPYLRDIAGRRGIQSFSVVCDASNNTEQVIATNNFVADIHIQPNYSINYITLNFIATKSGAVQFNITGA